MINTMDLTNKKILVVGATSETGEAIVNQLLGLGAFVVMLDHVEEKLLNIANKYNIVMGQHTRSLTRPFLAGARIAVFIPLRECTISLISDLAKRFFWRNDHHQRTTIEIVQIRTTALFTRSLISSGATTTTKQKKRIGGNEPCDFRTTRHHPS